MKSVHVLRHTRAERGAAGNVTPEGEAAARERASQLGQFVIVIASEARRAQDTARLLSSKEPEVDGRAGFYMAQEDKSKAIQERAAKNGESFLNAALDYAREHNDTELLTGIDDQADELVDLVQETLGRLPDGDSALIVTHDMTLIRALEKVGESAPDEISYLKGYVFHDDNTVEPTAEKRDSGLSS